MTGMRDAVGQTGHLMRAWPGTARPGARLPLVGALLAALLLAAVGLSACAGNPADAVTTVTAAHSAELMSEGLRRTVQAGDRVPPGALIRTDADGAATLTTAGRVTYLGASSAVRVLDGARQELVAGLTMIDTRRGPSLLLAEAAATVSLQRGALLRVERGAVLRVAAFSGSATVTPTGRRASTALDALYQVQVAAGALPAPATPLALTRDRWERDLARDLVSEDTDLTALAAGLDGPGSAGSTVLAVLPASWRAGAPVAAGAPRSEEALAFALAQAARTGAAMDRYARVRSLRDSGGSWGVVARLVGADVNRVSGALSGVLEPNGPPVVAVGAPPTLDLGALLGGGAPSVAPTSQGRPPTRPPSPNASPSATLPPAQPTPPPGAVQQVVDTVLGLLPTPTPVPVPPVPVPVPTPSPLVSVGVGNLGLTVG